jgi:hypothetical protein
MSLPTLVKKGIKLSLCLIKHHAIKIYVEVEVWLHAFLTSVLDGGDWSASHPGSFIPRYPLARRLGGPPSWSGCCGEENNVLKGIKPRFPGSPARTLLTALTDWVWDGLTRRSSSVPLIVSTNCSPPDFPCLQNSWLPFAHYHMPQRHVFQTLPTMHRANSSVLESACYMYHTNVSVGRSSSQPNRRLSWNQTDLFAKSARKSLTIRTSSRTLIIQCVTAAGTDLDFQRNLMISIINSSIL